MAAIIKMTSRTHKTLRTHLTSSSKMSTEETFGVFGSYAVVDGNSALTSALPTTGASSSSTTRGVKRSRKSATTAATTAPTNTQPSPRRPAPASVRLEFPSPYGILPEGCSMMPTSRPSIRPTGLGLAQALPDELVLYTLGFLGAQDLGKAGEVSRALYVFSHHGDLWKTLGLARGAHGAAIGVVVGAEKDKGWYWKSACMGGGHTHTPMSMAGFYSDLLFKHHACAASTIPEAWWKTHQTLDTRTPQELPPEAFFATYETPSPGRPLILKGAVSHWPALKLWTPQYLSAASTAASASADGGSGAFHCGGLPLPLPQFFNYTAAVSGRDDHPLYLFERNWGGLAPALIEHCAPGCGTPPPPHFSDDLSALLPPPLRPDHAWMIAGPRKSGSTFHKDPNASSAWNALVYGAKAWVLYPPHTTPPGVVVSGDGSEVATPVSVMEWYLDHFPAHRQRMAAALASAAGAVLPPPGSVPSTAAATATATALSTAPLCGIQLPGDVVFIPAGWWHQVLNLEDSLALTHNFISPRIVGGALELFRDDPAAISLPRAAQTSLYPAFVAALKEGRPEVWEGWCGKGGGGGEGGGEGGGGGEGEPATDAAAGGGGGPSPPPPPAPPGKWAALTTQKDKPFSFLAT